MANALTQEVTGLLLDWSNGDRDAYDKLVPLVHDELHRLAHYYMSREWLGYTLQTTTPVDEAYLRLIDQKAVRWQNRTHFFAIAEELMPGFWWTTRAVTPASSAAADCKRFCWTRPRSLRKSAQQTSCPSMKP